MSNPRILSLCCLLLPGCDALPYELDLGGDDEAAPAKSAAAVAPSAARFPLPA